MPDYRAVVSTFVLAAALIFPLATVGQAYQAPAAGTDSEPTGCPAPPGLTPSGADSRMPGQVNPSGGTSQPSAPSDPEALQAEDINLWGMVRRLNWIDILGEILLAVMGLYAVAVFLERWLTFGMAVGMSRGLENQILPAIRSRDFDAALGVCRGAPRSPLAALANPVVAEMKCLGKITALTLERIRLVADRACLSVECSMRKGFRNLLSVSVIAPMIGFLLFALDVREVFGSDYRRVDPEYMLRDLRAALFPLCFGLLVGLASQIAYRLTQARLYRLEGRINAFAGDLVAAHVTGRPSRRSRRRVAFPPGLAFLEAGTCRTRAAGSSESR
jgi:biopolymer transport protein ExbB/TolQ